MTLTFDPLTLNMCGRSGIMWSLYVPNLSEIGQSAAELLMMNDRFFVSFRGCSNTGIGIFFKRVDQSAPNMVGTLSDYRYTSSFKMVHDDILLGLQSTAAQLERWSAIRQKSHFLTVCKNWGRGGRDVWANY